MVGKKELVERITPEEALEIFQNSTLEEIYIAMDLYKAFKQAHGGTNDAIWDVLSLVSFAYMTGRVQGIREERSKKDTVI